MTAHLVNIDGRTSAEIIEYVRTGLQFGLVTYDEGQALLERSNMEPAIIRTTLNKWQALNPHNPADCRHAVS